MKPIPNNSRKHHLQYPNGTKAHELAREKAQAVCNTDKDKNKVERVYIQQFSELNT
ncbi:MAG: hypothetical protein WBF90_34975 [Rivularia sp. (in: cyanobacteria)]